MTVYEASTKLKTFENRFAFFSPQGEPTVYDQYNPLSERTQISDMRFAVVAMLLVAAFALMPTPALAQASSGSGWPPPFISDIGCTIVQWLKGPLAVLIFVVSVIVALVIGMIARMEWDRIIYLVVIFGIISGLGGLLANNAAMQSWSGLATCLQ
jgi:type IV secretion system protein TrbC